MLISLCFRKITLAAYEEWIRGIKTEGRGTSERYIAIIQTGEDRHEIVYAQNCDRTYL